MVLMEAADLIHLSVAVARLLLLLLLLPPPTPTPAVNEFLFDSESVFSTPSLLELAGSGHDSPIRLPLAHELQRRPPHPPAVTGCDRIVPHRWVAPRRSDPLMMTLLMRRRRRRKREGRECLRHCCGGLRGRPTACEPLLLHLHFRCRFLLPLLLLSLLLMLPLPLSLWLQLPVHQRQVWQSLSAGQWRRPEHEKEEQRRRKRKRKMLKVELEEWKTAAPLFALQSRPRQRQLLPLLFSVAIRSASPLLRCRSLSYSSPILVLSSDRTRLG